MIPDTFVEWERPEISYSIQGTLNPEPDYPNDLTPGSQTSGRGQGSRGEGRGKKYLLKKNVQVSGKD